MGKWMKAIACGLLLCLCISLCGFSAECGEIRERVLRLHILANSDSGEDQQLKLRCATRWCGRRRGCSTARRMRGRR